MAPVKLSALDIQNTYFFLAFLRLEKSFNAEGLFLYFSKTFWHWWLLFLLPEKMKNYLLKSICDYMICRAKTYRIKYVRILVVW